MIAMFREERFTSMSTVGLTPRLFILDICSPIRMIALDLEDTFLWSELDHESPNIFALVVKAEILEQPYPIKT
jgi:hypothetical protein